MRPVGDSLRSMSIALHVAAGLVAMGCAGAMAGASAAPGLWRPLAMSGGTIGLLAFAVFWDGQTQLLLNEGAIGAIISLALLLGALAFPRAL